MARRRYTPNLDHLGKADLRARINELDNLLHRMQVDKSNLEERVREFEAANARPRQEAAALAKALADDEGVELYRVAAWASNTGLFEHWDDAAGDYRYPDGWPEGVTPEGYIAKELGLGTVAPGPAPAPTNTTLHRMLDGRG